MKVLLTAFALIFCSTLTAQAYHRHHRPFHPHAKHHYQHRAHHYRHRHGVQYARRGLGSEAGRPHAWCGWYMRRIMGVADAAYNLAANWAHYGRATSPHVGAIVVWRHHVGKIVGGSPGRWEVLSGNDGHRVRTRVRSTAGAIAFRD